jgi:hypothetical protein
VKLTIGGMKVEKSELISKLSPLDTIIQHAKLTLNNDMYYYASMVKVLLDKEHKEHSND